MRGKPGERPKDAAGNWLDNRAKRLDDPRLAINRSRRDFERELSKEFGGRQAMKPMQRILLDQLVSSVLVMYDPQLGERNPNFYRRTSSQVRLLSRKHQ